MSKFYAVAKGRSTGIFSSWNEAKTLVDGYTGAKYKSFPTRNEASEWLTNPTTTVIPKSVVNFGYNPQAEPELTRVQHDPNSVVIYTDGSCIDQVGGWAYVIVDNATRKQIAYDYGRVPVKRCTNNIAELYAIGKAIRSQPVGTKIQLFTDSKYSINSISVWVINWIKNGWITSKGEPVENKKLIEKVYKMSDNVSFVHVKAHVGEPHNELADELANRGRTC